MVGPLHVPAVDELVHCILTPADATKKQERTRRIPLPGGATTCVTPEDVTEIGVMVVVCATPLDITTLVSAATAMTAVESITPIKAVLDVIETVALLDGVVVTVHCDDGITLPMTAVDDEFATVICDDGVVLTVN